MVNPSNTTENFNGQTHLPMVMSPPPVQDRVAKPQQDSLTIPPKPPTKPDPKPRSKSTSGPFAWFNNLPIGRKQIIAMALCELLPLLGLGLGSFLVLTNSLRSQLIDQSKSEAAVTETYYNTKINQMGFGSLGQADNPGVISASFAHLRGENLPVDVQKQLGLTLRNEVQTRKMEYATLVGRDLKIIASANKDRTGEIFDPGKLVSQVLKDKDGKQLKATALVSWKELEKEDPTFLPSEVYQEDALIRYVATPIRNPETKDVIGVLVFGDVVNGKKVIPESTLKTLGGGYSAIYMRKPNGGYVLASSLDQGRETDVKKAKPAVTLPNLKLLSEAGKTWQGKSVAQRIAIQGQEYTVAAKAIPNQIIETADAPIPVYEGTPPAILVRGTPEEGLNSLLRRSLLEQLIVASLAVGAVLLWTNLFRRTVLQPIKKLEETTQKFAEGDRTQRAEVFYSDEVGQLAGTFNLLADNINSSETALADAAERAERTNEITLRIRQNLKHEDILNTTVRELRQVLGCDRVIIYDFNDDWNGTIIAEAIAPGWRKILHEEVQDPFREGLIDQYKNGRVRAMNDIYAENLTKCHQELLEDFQIKASITAPMMKGEELMGLLCAHHCAGPRPWKQTEIELLSQIASQAGYALDQAEILAQREIARQAAESLSDEQRGQREALQQQLLVLLGNVEGAAMGDLTVRADVTAGEIGIVADFFNSIVESLRSIVTQVKTSALQVNSALGENEQSIRQLADISLKQAAETTETLNSVDEMTRSIQSVADSATEAALVTRTASQTAETSGAAMDLTVKNILNLRETIGETAKKVKRLGESSQQISKAVSLINQIAMQTNLLAINAGIEAARAGEGGQGFAVVAEEVSDLAARSAAATREIEQLVDTIQRETADVVVAMEQGTTQVVEGTRSVEQAKQSLGQILEVSRHLDGLVQSISDATVSQVKTSQTIGNLMENIALASGRSSQSSKQVSDALRQTVEVAKELQTSVETFKVI
jgi:twitching motility protein PilJ